MVANGRMHGVTFRDTKRFPCLLSLVRVVERHRQRVSRRVDNLVEKHELVAPDLIVGGAPWFVRHSRYTRPEVFSPHNASGWHRRPAAHLLPQVPREAVRVRDDAPQSAGVWTSGSTKVLSKSRVRRSALTSSQAVAASQARCRVAPGHGKLQISVGSRLKRACNTSARATSIGETSDRRGIQ